jgi:integration host factor alpha subunit
MTSVAATLRSHAKLGGVKPVEAPADLHMDSSKNMDAVKKGALTRQDLAEAISERCPGLSKREAKRLVDGVIDEMTMTLLRGETVKLHDFGSFVVRRKSERAGRNPRTGAKVPIEPRQVVVFKASPNMKVVVDAGTSKKPSSANE